MKTLEHTIHILEKNSIILIPVFFHVLLIQTIVSYVVNTIGITNPELILQNFQTLLPKFFWMAVISGSLVLLIDSFFLSMTLSMIFEAWKKGKTRLDWSYGTKFFMDILSARIFYLTGLFTLIAAFGLASLLYTASLAGILLAAFSGILIISFVLSFFWINESIVTKKAKYLQSFSKSKKTTFKDPLATAKTAILILALYLFAQSILNVASFANQIFLTTIVILIISILLKTTVSILKIVSFLQIK